MAEREHWTKALKCPVCDREGLAELSHPDDDLSQYEQHTTVDVCPKGFQARPDEDDSNIFRFFCIKDDIAADQ